MEGVWVYSLISAFVVSLISLVGIFSLGIKAERLRTILIYIVSFSAGALFGDAFLHLIPEAVEINEGMGMEVSLSVLSGIVVFFILEKIIQWHHCHMPITKEHVHSFAYMNIIGDCLHNFIDGLIIAASYIAGIQTGIATTIAVIFHEVPQEVGEFGILLHGGFSKKKALALNFVSALTAVLGAGVAIWIQRAIGDVTGILVPFAAGGFIYIAGSDLIPEIHKEKSLFKSVIQLIVFLVGIGIMGLLLLAG